MATAGVVATLPSTATVAYTLKVGGVDLVRQPGASTPYATDMHSVRVSELGPNGVGSMTFDVWDAKKLLSIQVGQEVEFYDVVLGEMAFAGYVETVETEVSFGSTGRIFHVRCVDYNVLLDRLTIPVAVTRAASLTYEPLQYYMWRSDWIQWLIGTYTPLRQFAASNMSGVGGYSTITQPVAIDGFNGGLGSQRVEANWYIRDVDAFDGFTIPAGSTVREAVDIILGVNGAAAASPAVPRCAYFVDFYRGFRFYSSRTSQNGPPSANGEGIPCLDATTAGDYTDDAGAGDQARVRDLRYEVDASNVTNAVYIIGGNAAGTGWVTDDDSIALYGRREAVVSDSTSTSVTLKRNIGQSYLAGRSGASIRGSFLWDFTGSDGNQALRHPGYELQMKFASLGQTAYVRFVIQQIDRRYITSTTRECRITFGGTLAPSAARLIRSLTS